MRSVEFHVLVVEDTCYDITPERDVGEIYLYPLEKQSSKGLEHF